MINKQVIALERMGRGAKPNVNTDSFQPLVWPERKLLEDLQPVGCFVIE